MMPSNNATSSRKRIVMALLWTISTTCSTKFVNGFLHAPLAAKGYTRSYATGSTLARRFRAVTTANYPIRLATTTTSEDETTAQQNLLITEAPTMILKRSRQSKAFRNGNQLVFTRAVQGGRAEMGALVQVCVDDDPAPSKGKITKNDSNDSNDDKPQQPKPKQQAQPIGWGVYNPESLYKIRILCHRYLQPQLYQKIAPKNNPTPLSVDEALFEVVKHHLSIAVRKRTALTLPEAGQHSMYRLVNGEGDCLSGLQVDVIDEKHVVVQSSAAWTEIHKSTVMRALEAATNFETIIWKVAQSRLKQDGYFVHHDMIPDDDEGEGDGDAVVALENGVKFQTFPALNGQKTGVYCDQRENRRAVAKFTQGKTVLDLCCFHGGFSLTALVQGGATLAVGVDSSAAAVEAATDNAKLNQCEDKATFLQSDISKYMHEAANDGIHYDVVVLDPPKLAPTVTGLDKARRKYHALNRDAIKLVNPTEGGILMTCTCSAAMTNKDGGQYFLEMVSGAALASGRQVTLLNKAGAASCHTQSPVSWPAGAYLTAALFYVHPAE